MTLQPITLVWFRRDLRLTDNTALQTAIRLGRPVAGAYVFDREADTPLSRNRRLSFLYDSVAAFQMALQAKNIPLYVLHGQAESEIPRLAAQLCAAAVVYAREDGAQAAARDNRVWHALDSAGREAVPVDDQTVLPPTVVMTHAGRPYTVFGPYHKAWLDTFGRLFGAWHPADDWAALAALQQNLPDPFCRPPALPAPETLGFAHSPTLFAGGEAAAQKQLGRFLEHIDTYHLTRDFPAQKGTSRLSPYIAHGMLSPRHLVFLAKQADGEGARVWLGELVWREFFKQVLFHHPEAETAAFRPEYRNLDWENRREYFERWKAGQTGYPIVDAAMRHLQRSGWLHNRLRMIAAGFLVKDLLIDWRWGEAWFAEQLIDYDLAANNGGWQWSAGTGCDAQPYFRIFNPVLQSQKFDPDGQFVRRHVPELAHLGKDLIHAPWRARESIDTHGYPEPMVDHAEQREKVLALFKRGGRAPEA